MVQGFYVTQKWQPLNGVEVLSCLATQIEFSAGKNLLINKSINIELLTGLASADSLMDAISLKVIKTWSSKSVFMEGENLLPCEWEVHCKNVWVFDEPCEKVKNEQKYSTLKIYLCRRSLIKFVFNSKD